MDEVKKVITFDSESGCSMADLVRGSEALGFQTELRFVSPQDVRRLPFPVIIFSRGSMKTGIGHFTVVTRYDPEKNGYSVIDTTLGQFSQWREESLLRDFSGYVLVARSSNLWSGIHLGLGIATLGVAFVLVARRFRRGDCLEKSAETIVGIE